MKLTLLVLTSVFCGVFSHAVGLTPHQAMSLAIFIASVLGTLFFWEFRLSFAFLGSALLLMTKAIDLENFLRLTTLEVILFLVGMMIVVNVLKDTGFFAWIVALIIRAKNLTGRKFTLVVILLSAFLACAVDEVTSIVFMVAAILEICDYYEVKAMPFVIISVLATNIGSAATVLGNPIGIIIATKAGLSFEDFVLKAMPLALVSLGIMIIIVMIWFRNQISLLNSKLKEHEANDILIHLISVPMEKPLKIALSIFSVMIVFIALHRRIEVFLGLQDNTMLLIMPLIAASVVMMWKWRKAREYVERGVEWWTLLFFMLLFAQAGTLKYTGATDVFAGHFINFAKSNQNLLLGMVLWSSSLGSSLLDNVIVVVTYSPIIKSFFDFGFGNQTLWWALLLGGCLGGNISLIGSTANIVALGILEKDHQVKVRFRDWLGIGLLVGISTTGAVWLMLSFLSIYK